jgi:hypothetical protein
MLVAAEWWSDNKQKRQRAQTQRSLNNIPFMT